MWPVLESFKSLVLAGFFWDFLWFFFYFLWLFFYFLWRPAFILQNPSHYDGDKCNHLWRFCDSLKAVTKNGYRKLQKSFFSWLFCDYLWPCLFLNFTSVLNRLTYIGCCRTNNYQKHICFSWSNITSLI
jgi:hypothetical protein